MSDAEPFDVRDPKTEEGPGLVARAVVILMRVVQVLLVGVAAVMVLGGVVGNMNVIAFAAVALFALVCLAFVAVVELAVRGVRRWSA